MTAAWSVITLPPLSQRSSRHHGPYRDQLRLELVQDNVTLTVRSPNPRAKRSTFAFFGNGEPLPGVPSVFEAVTLDAAARQVLELWRGRRDTRI